MNMARRMESQGQSGAIQITRSTYQLIRDEFVCEAQGTIDVRGPVRLRFGKCSEGTSRLTTQGRRLIAPGRNV